MKKNFVTQTDVYKTVHHLDYPENIQSVYSYFEARSGAKYSSTVFAGLQYVLKEYFEGVVVTTEGIDKAEKMIARVLGDTKLFNRSRWDYIVEHHQGKLPLRIKAVAEGTEVPINNVMMTVENTDSNCAWLTNHAETLLTHVWFPSNVATMSKQIKATIEKYLEKTSDFGKDFPGLPFMLHDFGYRGTSSNESAAIGGMAHLINFLGTDTIVAMELIEDYYGGYETGCSIPATEHSVMSAEGPEGETNVIQRLLDNHPTGLLSIVSDTYDIYRCVDEYYGVKFYDQIMARDGKVVVRPDSGNPVYVMCGDTSVVDYDKDISIFDDCGEVVIKLELEGLIKRTASNFLEDTPHGERGDSKVTVTYRCKGHLYKAIVSAFWNRYDKQYYYLEEDELEVTSNEEISLSLEDEGLLNILYRRFGGTVNAKGYKVLNPKVGIIWGDGIDARGVDAIMRKSEEIGFSTENLVFGMGGALLQKHSRYTLFFYFKCSAQKVSDEWKVIYKSPLDKSKVSKKGKLALVKVNGKYETLQDIGESVIDDDLLKIVFENGELVNPVSFDQVMNNASK